ncbi:MAG TPA: universal stress protein [Gemmatimonadales bacterium]|nr:universal stress protein [Gemmatimonadales bacterium]
MNLRQIVVAADESDAGRQAVRSGMDLASRASAKVTVMRTVPVPAMPVFVGVRGGSEGCEIPGEMEEHERLQRWLEADVLPPEARDGVETAVAFGLAGVEICRFAEARPADLLMLGRKPRSQMTRLLLGDTADAVARRSRLPCLFVPPGTGPIRRLLVALDGSERGLAVLRTACGVARAIGASVGVVTVEQEPAGEPAHLACELPVERSARLTSQVRLMLSRECPDGADAVIDVRRGPIVEQILRALEHSAADALVVGYHRGGPPGVIEAGSIARHLAHRAPCAVMTVPL